MTAVEKIDQLIKERSLSRRKLALMAKIPASSFQSAMQRKDIPLYMLESISKALEIPVASFLESDEILSEILMYVEEIIEDINESDAWEENEKRFARSVLQRVARAIGYKLLDMQLAGVDNSDTIAELIIKETSGLNELGQQVALERIKELAKIPDYQIKE